MEEERSIELFVSEEESSVLEKIALGEVPFSQRAQAILAADAGSNLEQAAGVSGLRVTQVRFWIGRFRHSRITVFPEAMIDKIKEQLRSESREEKTADEKTKKTKKKSKRVESEARKKDKQKKKHGKKKKDKANGVKGKKEKKTSKGKKAKKGKKDKKQKKKK